MRRKQWRKLGVTMLFLAMAAFALSGCSGSDGSTGATGPTGPAGPQGPEGPAGSGVITFDASNVDYLSKATYSGTITNITAGPIPIVEFRIVDGQGNGVEGLEKPVGTSKNLNDVRFTIAKLVPGANGSPSQWMSYFIPLPSTAGHEKVAANLTPLGKGNYRYTFKTDLTKVDGITYEPTLTHRLGIRFSGSIPGTTAQIKNSIIFVKDFIPTGGGVINQREITTKAACLECHGTFEGRSGGHLAYADPKMCVLCHTDQWRIGQTESTITGTVITPPAGKLDTDIVRGEALLNFINMIHKAHMGTQLTLKGYAHNNGRWLPNDMVYPQDIINCRKCHKESTATPQGDNWKNKPSRQACGSCHDGINFATGTGTTVKGATTGHAFGIPQTNDASCFICHDAVSIDAIYHVTANATPNNPNVPAGAVNFIYEISTVTVNESLQPVVKFRIKSYTGTDATTAQPVTFNNAAAATLLTGFTSGPSFLVTYALPQDGIATPVDYNNLGKASAQPVSASLDNIRKGTAGSWTGPDASGYYTATLTGTAAFPAGAKLRAVALQGYWTQVSPALARHTPGVIKAVTGDAVRRTVVDSAKCANCHEWFEGHGGNRVYEMQMCLPCHNPNLTSTGRTLDLTVPEATLNLKDMIHSIHAAEMRTNPYKLTGSRSGIIRPYDFSGTVYPGLLQTCEACHKPGTYTSVPAGALMTANVTTGDANATINPATGVVTSTDTIASLTTLRNAGLANGTDLVITPYAAACVSCHDGTSTKAHMTANGGAINESRSTVNAAIEQCAICHGAGRSADAAAAHANYQAGH